jgi:hypothetical protein
MSPPRCPLKGKGVELRRPTNMVDLVSVSFKPAETWWAILGLKMPRGDLLSRGVRWLNSL